MGFVFRELRMGLAAAAVLIAGGAGAESIAIDAVRQRTPWNGLVDFDYTIAGIPESEDPNDYQIEFYVTVGGRTFVASNFTDSAWCDHATANGEHRATWNARADGITNKVSVLVAASLWRAPVTDASAEFAIIDLSEGSGSDKSYPVHYVKGDTNRIEQFNIDVYKTTKLVLRKVHAGEFWMGEGNVSSGSNRHRVRLTKDYFLGLFEVTQKQYGQVCSDTTAGWGYYYPGHDGKKMEGEDTRKMPASRKWYDMIMSETDSGSRNDSYQYHSFMRKLNERVVCRGQSVGLFCLPTEAQWEYACRAGTETTYYWGDDVNDYADYAWTPDTGYQAGGGTSRIHEAGLLAPNAWGFYDMSGNIQEWCSDFKDSYPAYSETEVTVDPTGADQAENRVLRGGSHWHTRTMCASGARDGTNPSGSARTGYGYIGNAWGFRLCHALKEIP